MTALDEVEEQSKRLWAIMHANTDRILPDVGAALCDAIEAYSAAWEHFADAVLRKGV